MNEEILVMVRAIPEKSERHGYLICVAGINERNEWRRLYPFKFSYGEGLVDFGKKDIIDVILAYPDNDKRRESRKVITHEKEGASLGIIKPELTGIDIIINSTDIYDQQKYFSLADDYLERREKVKMPVELRYKFKCKDETECKGHTIILIDWELNELVRNVMRNEKDKKIIEDKIRLKFFDFMKTRDLYFLMGTHFRFDTWIIIGLFYPQKRKGIQTKLGDI